MNISHYLRRFRRHPRAWFTTPRSKQFTRRISLEWLEQRTVLSANVFIVNSTADFDSDPTTLTLREAITAANATINLTEPDEIRFNIPATNSGHDYYHNDGLAGQVSTSQIMATVASDDSLLSDPDPDWPHSWFTIRPGSALPPITDAVVLDGYTQPGARPNTMADGDNAVLRIELNGSGALFADGLGISAGGSTVRGLVINRFDRNGIILQTNGGDRLIGNRIGTDVSGNLDLGNDLNGIRIETSGNTIGGTTSAARNLISGNEEDGILIFTGAGGNLVQGNYIGTSAAGTADLGNSDEGVHINQASGNVIGGTMAGTGNLISGNNRSGISIIGTAAHIGNQVLGNRIGTGVTGTTALGNSFFGVAVQGVRDTQVGGTASGAGNTIGHNGLAGVIVSSTSAIRNAILSNAIYSNGGLGIDIQPNGPNFPQDPGDADTGANNQQNFPVLTSAQASPTRITIDGTLSSTPNTMFRIELFASAAADPTGFGEGQVFLGAIDVNTGSSGIAAFTATLPISVSPGQLVTATATDPTGNTSEFSATTVTVLPQIDFGDAPAPYPTLTANNGARHNILAGFHLGSGVDSEADGQPSSAANRDDTQGTDDEDGIVFTTPLEIGMTASLLVNASQPGLLAAWIDFNRDGDWADAGEQVFVNRSLASGTNSLSFTVPLAASPGESLARFRFGSQSNLSFDGLAPDGEVEDHPIIIVDNREFDYGDAPAGYSTLLASDGARHAISTNVKLGNLLDSEDDGHPSLDADGDDLDALDDEDGVSFTSPLLLGEQATISVRPSIDGLLSAWINFNLDADFADPGEQVLIDQAVVPGPNQLVFPVPEAAIEGQSFARFRFSTQPGLAYNGPADDGEVEDYLVLIQKPGEIRGSKWNDLDADGVRDDGEPGLEGWTIFLDRDDDGLRDVFEPLTTTDANGNYSFTGLEPDTYIVAERPQVGWELTYPSVARGDPLRVNTYTDDSQRTAAIAMNDTGQFVIAWTSYGQDSERGGIYAQRYAADGTALGDEFQVNTTTADSQDEPSVAMDDTGDFVVVWESWNQDGDGLGIFAQMFDADGSPRGDEFQVNAISDRHQSAPSIAIDDAGNFVIAWLSGDGHRGLVIAPGRFDVFARTFDRDGNPHGDEFQVNSFRTSNAADPSTAMDGDGNFIVTWATPNLEGEGHPNRARRYHADGTEAGGEFQVSSDDGSQFAPSVAMNRRGDFVISWAEQDGSGSGIFAQRYAADGTALGPEFLVNTVTPGGQSNPSVAIDQAGNFVVAWLSVSRNGTSVNIQQFESNGTPRSFEVSASSNTTSTLDTPAVAMDDTGHFMVAWTDSSGPDSDVFARRLGENGVHIVPVAQDQLVDQVNFGNFRPAEIRGSKWEDIDGDGVINANAPPVDAWRIFLDDDLDNWPDVDERQTVTNSIGEYQFLHLPPGTYTIAEVLEEGWRETSPGEMGHPGLFYGAAMNGSLSTLSASGVVTALEPVDGVSEITGFAYDSTDGILYGSTASGDLWSYDAITGGAAFIGTLPTPIADGLAYNPLDDLLYSVTATGELIQIDPAALTATVVSGPGPGAGADGVAFDPTSNRIYAIDAPEFGIGQAVTYSYDAETFDGPVLYPDAILSSVPALTHDGTQLVIGVSDHGSLNLSSFDPQTGNQTLLTPWRFFSPSMSMSNLEFVPGDGGGPGSHTVTVAAGDVAAGNDFANYFYFSEISGFKYEDVNENGERDADEPGLSGWVIYVDMNDNGTRDADEPSDVTFRGEFTIAAEIPPGSYKVRESPQVGWVQTEPADGAYTIDASEGSSATGLVFGNRKNLDYGDAPDPTYPTQLASDGASHRIRPGFFLGNGVDDEPDGQPAVLADGDDSDGNDDEDGVEFLLDFVRSQEAAIRVTASAVGRLDAWFDWNGDGDWDDAGEQVFDDRGLVAGPNVLSFDVPTVAVDGFARFRFSSFGVQSYDGPAADGEVEDYAVHVSALGACPDDQVFADGEVLHLAGDLNNNRFLVDLDPAGRIIVSDTATCSSAFVGIRRIVAELAAGDDQLSLFAPVTGMLVPIVVDVHTDQGDDQVVLENWHGNVMVDLGPGADLANIRNIGGGSPDPSGRQLSIAAGPGDDTVDVTSNTFFDIFIDLGAGKDKAGLALIGGGTPDPSTLQLTLAAGGGDDDVNVMASNFSDVSFDIDLGTGNDRAAVEIPIDSLSIPGKVRELRGTILGAAGDDIVQSCIPMSFFDVFLDFDLGTGNDVSKLEFQVARQIIPAGERRSIRADVTAGAGNDMLQVDTVAAAPALPVPAPAVQGFFDVFLNLNLGTGNDQAAVEWPTDPTEIVGKVRELHLTVDAGAGDDVVQDCDPMTIAPEVFIDVNLGPGNDTFTLQQQALLTGTLGRTSGKLIANVDAGTGHDVVQILFEPVTTPSSDPNPAELGFFDVFLNLNLGAGNDRAAVEWPNDPAEIVGKVRELHLTIDGRAGNDIVQDCDPATLPAKVFVNIDLGAGDDTADLRYVGGGTPDPGALSLTVVGGAGNDRINVMASSFFAVDIGADLGAGDDQFVLALNPNPLPVEDVTSIVHVNINGGSGIDSAVVDVEHFTITELLTSLGLIMQIMEVLSVAFATGSESSRHLKATADLTQQLRDGAGSRDSTFAMTLDGPDFVIDVTTGASDDLIKVQLDAGTDPASDGSVRFSADTGSGNDSAELVVPSPIDVFADLDLGAGHDRASVRFPGDPGELIFRLNAGAGNDEVELLASGQAARPWDVTINLGDGRDKAVVELPSDLSELKFLLNAGAGNDEVRLLPSGQAAGPWDVIINLGAGNDSAFVELPSDPGDIPPEVGPVALHLFAGAGNDLINCQLRPHSDLLLELDLGAGNDRANLRLAGSDVVDPTGKVRELRLKMLGGSGNDYLWADISASAADVVFADFDGGLGNDLIRVNYREATPTTSPSPRELHIQALGGDGNDDLALRVTTARRPALLDLLLDGGNGRDRYWATPNVRVRRCEIRRPSPPPDL